MIGSRWWAGILATALAAAALLVAGDVGAEAAHYEVVELLDPRGKPMVGETVMINDAGQVAGTMFVGPEEFDVTGVVWEDGHSRRIAPEPIMAVPNEIAESGQVVGTELESTGGRGFSWLDGALTWLPSRGFAVNEAGEVLGSRGEYPEIEAVVSKAGRIIDTTTALAGSAINEHGQALVELDNFTYAGLWQVGGEVTNLGTLDGDFSHTVDVNDAGQVTGDAEVLLPWGPDTHAYFWADGTMTDMGTLGGGWSQPTDINNLGQVVGASYTESGELHAFIWENGAMSDLGTLGGSKSFARAINDQGQVVGQSDTADGEQHAVLWHHGEIIDLGALSGDTQSQAYDINERGQVVGIVGKYPDSRALLWTPSNPAD